MGDGGKEEKCGDIGGWGADHVEQHLLIFKKIFKKDLFIL